MADPVDWAAQFAQVNDTAPTRKGPCRVAIAHLHPGEVSTSFAHSLQRTVIADAVNGSRLFRDGVLSVISSLSGAGQLHKARNEACQRFLDADSYVDSEILVFIDSDMGWDWPAFDAIVATVESDPKRFPIVGGLCFGTRPASINTATGAVAQRWFPTIYAWSEDGAGFDTRFDLPDNPACIEVAATGAAFVAIHRSVLEAIREAEGDVWFEPIAVEVPGRREPRTFGEDMSFCARARQLGFSTWVHTAAETSHHKDVWVTRDAYDDLRHPTGDHVTVVIPVKDNLAMTKGVVGELYQQGGFDDLLIFDNGSTDPEMVAWLAGQAVAEVFDASDAKGIHEMWNRGVEEAFRRHTHPTVVFLNNDLQLGPQFCQRLVADLHRSGATAVSANYDNRLGRGVQKVHGICAGRYDGSGGLAGFAYAVTPSWFASGWRFDESMRWWFGDNDLCLAIEQSGGWYGISLRTEVVHLGGGSQTETPDGWDDIVAADRDAFEAKWPGVTLTPA